ncbi:hypothetical protein PC113_g20227 [Phytophthora cactorum]|nr:hypothetical protein PC113_g20227 [Phytophthora cactorum]
MKQISTDLKVDENDQESMRTLLKAQHRWSFDDQELKLLTLEPLSLSTPTTPAKLETNTFVASCSKVIALESLNMASPIMHGDVVRLEGELINIGRSSLTLQVTGCRHDIATRRTTGAG